MRTQRRDLGAGFGCRDNFYMVSRLIGAARANVALPSLEFETAASNVAETAGQPG